MRKVTLCFLIKDGQVLLGMKKRGFGKGKWNGFGGKVEENEDLKTAVLRELQEEAGVRAQHHHLKDIGHIRFYFNEKSDWDQHMQIFVIHEWQGKIIESEEMKPAWFTFDQIPLKNMWIDDKYWFDLMLSNKKFTGEFYLDATGDNILKHKINKL